MIIKKKLYAMKHLKNPTFIPVMPIIQVPYVIYLFAYFLQCVHTTCVQLHNMNMQNMLMCGGKEEERISRRSSTHVNGKEQQTEDASSGCFVFCLPRQH